MKYNLPCLVKANRGTKKKEQPETNDVFFGKVLSDLEILDIVEAELNDETRSVAMKMNEIHVTYVNLLKENEFPVHDNPRYKVAYT